LSDRAYREAGSIYKKYNVQGELWKIYNGLAEVNEQLNRPDSALQFLKARILITDTLHSEEEIAKLYEIEEQYESERTKRALAVSNSELPVKKQQSQQLLFIAIIAALLTLTTILFFMFRIRKNKEAKQKELLLQKLEISSELHDNIGSQLTYLNIKLEQVKIQN
jgi:hypothetical protein